VKSPYLNEKSSDFDEIWCTSEHLELDDSQVTKYETFKDSRRRMAAILKIVFFAITKQRSRLPDFSEILRGEAVFLQNFGNETDTHVP